jgi:hypothetical protein
MPPYAHILVKIIPIDDFLKIRHDIEFQLSLPNEKWYALFELSKNVKYC